MYMGTTLFTHITRLPTFTNYLFTKLFVVDFNYNNNHIVILLHTGCFI